MNSDNISNENQLKHLKNSKSAFLKNNWIKIAVLLYLVSPVDVIPEGIFPILGSIDDILVAIASIYSLWKREGTRDSNN